MSPSGCSTLEGTVYYRDRFKEQAAENHFRNEQNLWLSSVGIGTYLGSPDDITDGKYTQAVVRAVELGANVIDTAANYRFQRSERSIGKALHELTNTKGFKRAEILICTKGGYLPFDGATPRDVRGYIEDTFVRPGIARLEDFVGGSHCMTPGYLQNQLEQSLRNMQLECVDVYYIHNPESQLGAVSEEEFYSRLRAAFERLEQNVAQGKIKCMAWHLEGFRCRRKTPGIIRYPHGGDGPRGRRRVAWLPFHSAPFNLAMPEALVLRNQIVDEVEVSTLEAAAALGAAVVSSASILQGGLRMV